jgi:hypothetical protein
MKQRGLLIILCLLLLWVRIVSAQDTFPVEQRCIDAPTAPPDGWTYPGTILMSGYAGIHAMQADWETPRVVASIPQGSTGGVAVDGGQISPDQNWYAVPIGDVTITPSLNQIWEVRSVWVYSLLGDGSVFKYDFPNTLGGEANYIYFPVLWQTNETFTIGGFQVDLSNSAMSTSDFYMWDFVITPDTIAPDLTRGYGEWVTKTSSGIGIFNLSDSSKIASVGDFVFVSWQRDSAGFIAAPRKVEGFPQRLVYYDRDGEVAQRVVEISGRLSGYTYKRPMSGRSELQWSPNDRYFAFVENFSPETKPNKLYLVDMQEQIFIDTCLSALNAPVWSPDGTMFAYLADASDDLKVMIVDMKTWQSYDVARHSGLERVMSYYSYVPEMLGWRNTSEIQ